MTAAGILHQEPHFPSDTCRLWSLWDMFQVYVQPYVQLGARLLQGRSRIAQLENLKNNPDPNAQSEAEKIRTEMRNEMVNMRQHCEQLDLPVSKGLLDSRVYQPPQTSGELDIIIEVFFSEIKAKVFLCVPSHRGVFYEADNLVGDDAKAKFPDAYAEIRSAGNAFAASLYTASVFHSMRAAELGLREVARSLNITFPFPIDLADWQNLIEKIESEIKNLSALPKGTEKDRKTKFYSESAVHFRYFKDAWRIRVSHARETYSEAQALTVLNHVREFFDAIASELPAPPEGG